MSASEIAAWTTSGLAYLAIVRLLALMAFDSIEYGFIRDHFTDLRSNVVTVYVAFAVTFVLLVIGV